MNTLILAAQDTAAAVAPDLMPSMWRMVGALVVVLALLAGLAWVMKRVVAKRKGGALSVEAALALGERRSLAIVTVEGRRLLLGLAPNHVSLVIELVSPTFDAALTQASSRESQS